MIISLITESQICEISLPSKILGKYVVTAKEDFGEVQVQVEGIDGKWFLVSGNDVNVLNQEGQPEARRELGREGLYPIEYAPLQLRFRVLITPHTTDRIEYDKYVVRDGTHIAVGRQSTNDIVINNRFISNEHFELSYSKDQWMFKDCGSSNGTYVNGKRCEEASLKYGDLIFAMGYRFIVGRQFISINNPDQSVTVNENKLIQYHPQEYDPKEMYESAEEDYFYRSPRFKRDVTPYKVNVDLPPQNQNGDQMPIMMTVGPAMTMGMASLVSGIYGAMNGNMISMVTSGCMLLGVVLWPILSRTYDKRRREAKEKLRVEKYHTYIDNLKAGFVEETEKQKEIIRENAVSVDECAERIMQRSRNLWERSQGQNDFLSLRVGTGNVDLDAEVNLPERKFEIEDDILEEEVYEFMDEPKRIQDVPITVSLFDHFITGVIGDRNIVKQFANGLILQLAALYSYDEVKFVFLTGEDDFRYAKWLPHVWNDEKTIRFFASSLEEAKDISSYLVDEFDARKELNDEKLADARPYYVVFALDRDLTVRSELLDRICNSKRNQNFSVLCFFDDLWHLPKECSNVIDLQGESSGKIYDKNDTSGKSVQFRPDIFVESQRMQQLSLQLANTPMELSESTYQLPKMITFLEMYGVGKVEHLNPLSRWQENDPTQSLAAQVGVDTFGDPFYLDLHEDQEGPHGLIAGMTGSGKSEFIMTYILSMAINFSPDEVAFILIDYKGGGMAKAFENLPHTAGIITNLDGASVNRSLVSIQSELTRRQEIFAAVSKSSGISNIDIYKYQKMYREGTVSEPLQHLFIISDEFAELKTQQPEFMEELVSASRIGRSLGVHLILATQKPSGVVDDQIWSNARFHICLKVQDKADSMDMLKRPEAAELKETGRFYLQVGYNELFKLGQSGWAGAPYYPSENVEEHVDDSVEVVNNVGKVLYSVEMDKRKSSVKKPNKQIDEITKYITQIAESENMKARQLWLEPIPAFIYVEALKAKYGWTKTEEINPIIGEYDDPMNQAQHLLTLPFSREGNAVVYGMTGGGKTTFITTMIYSLITSYDPEDVNIYILDFAAETLTAFAEAPQVGDVILSYETEKVNNLFKLLLGQMQTRKKLFAEYGGDINTYNKTSGQKMPSIVVAINGYAAFTELYDDLISTILQLTREGTKYGIYFILTAAATNSVGFRLIQNFKQVFVLQLADDTDYSGIIGKTDGLVPEKIKGRGLVRLDAVYEFQTAYPFESENQTVELQEICRTRRQECTGRARRVPVLPDVVDMEFVSDYVEEGSLKIPVGVEADSLDTSYYDFEKSYVNTIQSQGDEYVGFTSILTNLISEKAGIQTMVFDPTRQLRGLHAADVYSTKQEVNDAVEQLFNIVLSRHNDRVTAQENGEELPVYEDLVAVMVSLTEIRAMLDDEHKEMLELIFERGRTNLNVYLIVADTAKSIGTFAYDKWFKTNAAQNDAIWIGNGLSDQFFINITKTTPDMMQELPAQYGFIITHGKPAKMKVLSNGEED